jgi:hypothetical protein
MTIFELICQLKELAKEYGNNTEVKLYSGAVEIAEVLGSKRDHDTPFLRMDASNFTGEVELLLEPRKNYKELMS